jgi:hypothetical protein
MKHDQGIGQGQFGLVGLACALSPTLRRIVLGLFLLAGAATLVSGAIGTEQARDICKVAMAASAGLGMLWLTSAVKSVFLGVIARDTGRGVAGQFMRGLREAEGD